MAVWWGAAGVFDIAVQCTLCRQRQPCARLTRVSDQNTMDSTPSTRASSAGDSAVHTPVVASPSPALGCAQPPRGVPGGPYTAARV